MTLAGFPHSGITGSKPACGSPMLFAAYHALHRLSVPRHPPCALIRLTGNARTRRPSINRISLRCTPHELPAAYGCTPRSPLVVRLDLCDFSRPALLTHPPRRSDRSQQHRGRSSPHPIRTLSTTHTQNPKSISIPRKEQRHPQVLS